jgi:hypothetical protein
MGSQRSRWLPNSYKRCLESGTRIYLATCVPLSTEADFSTFRFRWQPKSELQAEIWPAFCFQRNASPEKTTKLPLLGPESGTAQAVAWN